MSVSKLVFGLFAVSTFAGASLPAQAEIIINGSSAYALYTYLENRAEGVTRGTERTFPLDKHVDVDTLNFRGLLTCGKIHNRVFPDYSYFCRLQGYAFDIQGQIRDGYYYGPHPFTLGGTTGNAIWESVQAMNGVEKSYSEAQYKSPILGKRVKKVAMDLIICERSWGNVFKSAYGSTCVMPLVNPYDTNISRTTSSDDDND